MRILNLVAVMLAGAAVGPARGVGPATALECRGTTWVGGHRTANVVVWLDAPDAPVLPQPRVVLDQRTLTFSPHVLAVRVGTKVEFPNNDRVFHNVFSWRDGKRFDLGMYPVGATMTQTFDRPGLSRIFCNIHPNMAAYVMAVETSYFAVSDAAGAFRLPPLPAGSYAYHAWRPGGEIIAGSVALGGDAAMEIRWP
jgi:plastocyanin